MSEREPWLAVVLALVFPGAGHYYVGDRRAAPLIALAVIALIGLGATLMLSPGGSMLLAFALLGLVPLLYVGSAVHAHALARRTDSPEFDSARRSRRDGWKAVFFSDLLPGVGQCYAGRWIPGLLLALGSLVLALFEKQGAAVIAQFVVRGFALWDAWWGGAVRRTTAVTPSRIVLVVLIAQPLAQAGLTDYVRAHWVQAFRMPSESMLPTLRPGDYVFVDRTRRGRTEAGDIVAFPLPGKPDNLLLKRVVAVGGQTVAIAHKQLIVDGRTMDERYVQHTSPQEDPEGYTPRDNYSPPTLPSGACFVLGDNRDDSYDSRYWGPVESKNVLGRAYKIYWPLDRAGPIRHP